MIIPFKTFIGESDTRKDWFDSDSTLISMTAFEKVLFENNDIEGCFIIPKNIISKNENTKIRSHFKEHRFPLYPVSIKNKSSIGRMYLILKKPHSNSTDFKESLSDSYYALKNFNIIYFNNQEIKTLKEGKASTYNEKISKTSLSKLISELLNKKTEIFGLETPNNEDIVYYFTENNLISYKITPNDRKCAITWKKLLNE